MWTGSLDSGSWQRLPERGVATRGQILEATHRLLRERGLAGTTTRAIAELAGCAEGSIYRYFPDKHALFHEIVHTRFAQHIQLMMTLPDRAGRETVERNLVRVAAGAIEFYRGIVPMVTGALSDRELLDAQRLHWQRTGAGPARALTSMREYLRREQRLGRVRSDVDPDAGSRLLLGTCFAQAMLVELIGEEEAGPADRRFARRIVRTLLKGVALS
jgi:AcrR family transcriptional regulator